MNDELHRVTCTAIIYKENGDSDSPKKFLITKRALSKKAFPGKWTVPGGGIKVGDYANTPATREGTIWYFALENGLRREVTEEVGVDIGKVDYLLDLAIAIPEKEPALVLSFYAPWKSGEVKLNDGENIEHAWVTFEEAKKYDLIGGIIEELEMVDKILTGKDPSVVKF